MVLWIPQRKEGAYTDIKNPALALIGVWLSSEPGANR